MEPPLAAVDFRRVFEVVPGCYLLLSPDLNITGVSDAYLAATMTQRERVLGRPLFEVFPDNPADPAATGVANLKASLMRVLEKGRPDRMPLQKYDIRTSADEGATFEERYWSPLNLPVLDEHGSVTGIVHSVEDVTSSVLGRAAESAAKLSAERLVDAVESLKEGFALFDATRTLVLCNAVYREYLGEPLLARSYAEIHERFVGMALDSSRDWAPKAEDVDQRSEWTFDVTTKRGQHLRVCGRRTREGGIVKVVWDLTEDERRAEELRFARTEAEQASAAKSRFLSSMSHELRTPLNAILGFAQLLQRDKRDPLSVRQRDHIQQIVVAGTHLVRLIDEVLDLSRVESGSVGVSIEAVDVRDALAGVLRTLEPLAEPRQIALMASGLDLDLPPVAADALRVKQILMNLGSNAIKYSQPQGLVRFRVSQPNDSTVRISVEDSGIGVPKELQNRLFQPFQRAAQEGGTIPGTGIGLAISRRLAELMQGRMDFVSSLGVGSTFWLELPVHPGALVVRLSESAEEPADAEPLAGATLLYVEDNAANVAFMRELFAMQEGVELRVAATAEEGVELARAWAPSLILMDVNLPGMSGLDAFRVLRAETATATIPVVALTAAATSDDRLAASGFDAYLTKPIQVEALLDTIRRLLGDRR